LLSYLSIIIGRIIAIIQGDKGRNESRIYLKVATIYYSKGRWLPNVRRYMERSMLVWYMVDMAVCEDGGVELLGWNIVVQRKGPL
jgi:hypothetical protein